MRVALEAPELWDAESGCLEAVNREVTERLSSSAFADARDVRLRLRRAKGALLCVAIVGFAGGDLVTSTATSNTPLEAIAGALEALPNRIDRIHRTDRPDTSSTMTRHAAVRAELKRLLDRA
jgi:hypothetical protein